VSIQTLPATVPLLEARALVLIGAHTVKYGQPPLWSEIGRALGLDRWQTQELLWGLRRNRLVWFTEAPRSLRLRSGAAAIALRSLRVAA
jgi:DNA-binding IclR family transcriptional regulator